MTVSNEGNRTSAVGTGAEQTVPFTFPITNNSDIVVTSRIALTGVETLMAETTDYTVVNSGTSGGSITTVTPFIASTLQIHIVRDTPNTQGTDLQQGGAFSADNVENMSDKVTKLTIENADALERTLVFPTTDPASSFADMPNSVDRASKNLTFDSAGKPTASVSDVTGAISHSTIGTNIAGAANAAAERALLELSEEIVTAEDADNYADFATAITSIGATETELHVHTSQAVTANVTVPATLTLVFHRGGDLAITSGDVVTINGDIKAGWYIIFTGDGTVVYNGQGEVKYNWFGTGAAALTDAIAFLGTGSRVILLPGGDIDFSTTAVVIDKIGCIVKGQGRPVYDGAIGTRIIYTGAGVGLTVDDAATAVVLQDFQIQGSASGVNGIKIGGGVGVHQTQMKNIAIDDFTGVGLEVDFLISGSLESVSVKACGTGVKIVSCFAAAYKDLNIVNSTGIGLSLEPGAAGEIAYSRFESFAFTGNGFEAVNIGGTGGIRNNTFETFQMETSQQDGARTDGFYHWLVTSNGYTSKVVRNTLSNIFFSSISNPWNGTAGNRHIKLQGGRWYIENLNGEASALTGTDWFVATDRTLLNLGDVTERELSRWSLPVTVELEGKVTPLKVAPIVSVAGGTASDTYETVATYTVPKNTTGALTGFGSAVIYADGNDDLTGGTAGIHIIVQGNRTTGAVAAARITFGGNTVAEIANSNDDNLFMMEAWIYNRNAAGLRYVMARNFDGADGVDGTAILETSGPTVDPTAAADIDIDIKRTTGGQATINTVFIERF